MAGSHALRRLRVPRLRDEIPEVKAMPPRTWSKKRERQYEHVKDSLEDRGYSDDKAEEIAARTVNKERARAGEARNPSKTSTDDISSGRRGGLRSTKARAGARTTSCTKRPSTRASRVARR